MFKNGSIFSTGSLLLAVAITVPLSAAAELLWDNRDGSAGNYRIYNGIASSGHLVFAVGEAGNFADIVVTTPTDDRDAIVRAIDANTGATVWQDRLQVGPFDTFGQVAVDGDRVFVGGTVRKTGSFTTADIIVRSYDANSGQLLWQSVVNKGSGDFAHTLIAGGGRVFVGGQVTNASGNRDFYVHALDRKNGSPVWQDSFDLFTGSDRAFAIALSGDRLVVAGTRSSRFTGDPTHLIVRAYDAVKGTLLWSDAVLGANNFFLRNSGLIIHGGIAFVGGTAVNSSNNSFDFMVGAYDVNTGVLRWQNISERGGSPDTVFELAVDGDRLFAVGQGGPGGLFNGDLVIRAFNANTGAVLWDQQMDAAGGDDFYSSVIARGNKVIACGTVTNAQGNYDFLVRVFDARTGLLQWQDQVDTGGDFEIGFVLTVEGNRVYVGGVLGHFPPGVSTAVVRAYGL